MAPSETHHSALSSPEQPMTKRIKTATTASANGSSEPAKVSSAQTVEMETRYSAHNYHPLPVVFARASGAKVWDPEGHEYLDFLSAYSAVNQGHCHPKIVKALVDQASTLTLSSRAFYNDMYGQYAKFVTEYFGYDMVLPMNTGAEAVETGIKLARRWGYMKKGIPSGQAIVFSVEGNFHGRTIGVVSMSTDPESRDQHGPYLPLVGATDPTTGKVIRYNHIEDLQEAFERHSANIAGLIIEPIQGEAGIIVPDDDYFSKVRELCTKHNVLLIADEIQTGIARTGKMLCVEHYNIRPDVILLGKALSGGVYPVSAVLADKDIMLCFEPGTHGSTYGGNPLACAAAIAALNVVKEENLVERAAELGEYFRSALRAINSPLVETIRGKGLLNAMVIDETKTNGRTAWQLCLLMKKRGLLAKPTHENIIRLAPPLVISKEDLERGVGIIKACLDEFLTAEIPDESAEEQGYHPTLDE